MKNNFPSTLKAVKTLKRLLPVLTFLAFGQFANAQNADLPEIMWSRYLGGNGSDEARAVITDDNGNIYMVGSTAASTGFALNGHQTTFGGGACDAYLTKMNTDGEVVWSTYIGGEGDDYAVTVVFTPSGQIAIGGNTSSQNGIAENGHQLTFGGGATDGFIAIYNTDGTHEWTTYFGAEGAESINALAIAPTGEVFAAGKTSSAVFTEISLLQGEYAGGASDGFITKYDAFGAYQWFGYIGGTEEDELTDVKINPAGEIFISGFGGQIPLIGSLSPIQPAAGSVDGFVARLHANGGPAWAKYMAGSGTDAIQSLSIDNSGNIIAVGCSNSASLHALTPITGQSAAGSMDAFLVKFTPSGLVAWSSFFGGNGADRAEDIQTDLFGNIYITGNSTSNNLNVIDAFQATNNGGQDIFISSLNTNGTVRWASMFGGAGDDNVSAVATDTHGKIILCGKTFSNDLDGQISESQPSGAGDAMLLKVSACNNPLVSIHSSGDTTFCQGEEVLFCASGADHFLWSTGDTTMTISADSTMLVSCIGTNQPSCSALSNRIQLQMLPAPIIDIAVLGETSFCDSGTVWLTASGGLSYHWTGGSTNDSLFVTNHGNYNVTGVGENGCEGRSDNVHIEYIEQVEVAAAVSETLVCVSGPDVSLIAVPFGGWFEGPGVVGNHFDPLLAGPGTHAVAYNYSDDNGCITTSDSVSIEVLGVPTVIFVAQDTLCAFDPGVELVGQPAGGSFYGDGVTDNFFYPQESGIGPQNIMYTYVDEYGCTNVAHQIIDVSTCLSTEELVSSEDFTVYPNPASQMTTIKASNNAPYTFKVIASNGQIVATRNGNGTVEVDVANFADGIYYIQLISNNQTFAYPLQVQR